jgi:L-rhamnose mutarotase
LPKQKKHSQINDEIIASTKQSRYITQTYRRKHIEIPSQLVMEQLKQNSPEQTVSLMGISLVFQTFWIEHDSMRQFSKTPYQSRVVGWSHEIMNTFYVI